jgi:hypothetical protein
VERPRRRDPWLRSLLLAPVLLALAAPAVAADTWYVERIMTGPFPMRVENLWSQGPDLHMEGVYAGHPILTLVKGDQYMTIDLLTRQGVSIQRSPKAMEQDKGRERPFGNALAVVLAAGGEKVGTEEIPGGRCDLYRDTDSRGRQEVCVSQDKEKLPLVVRIFDRASGSTTMIHYVDWRKGMSIGDFFFTPPPDVKLEQMSYDEYMKRSSKEMVGPAPPVMSDLLHGR